MTTWQEVAARGKEVARILNWRGRRTGEYRNTHGNGATIHGWRLRNLGTTGDPTEYSGATDYKDVYVHNYLVLGNDGVIYNFMLLHVENGRREPDGFRVTIDKTPSAHAIYPQMLDPVLHERLRPGDVMHALGSLAKKKNSDPEPTAPDYEKSVTFIENTASPAPAQMPGRRYIRPVQPSTPFPIRDPQEEGSPWKTEILLGLGAFAFLAILAIIFLLSGAELN